MALEELPPQTPEELYDQVFGKYAFQEISELPIEAHCMPPSGPPAFMKRKANALPGDDGPEAYETDEEYLQSLRNEHFVNSLDHLHTDNEDELNEFVRNFARMVKETPHF